jgi:hypothetical protein
MDVPGQRLFQEMWRVAAARAGAFEIAHQGVPETGVNAVLDDFPCPLPWRQLAKVGEPVLRDDDVDVMLGVIDMGHHRNDDDSLPSLASDFVTKIDRKAFRAKSPGSADAIHHVRAVDMRRVDIAVYVEFQRRIDADHPPAGG